MIEYAIAQYYKPEIYALQVSQFARYIFTKEKVKFRLQLRYVSIHLWLLKRVVFILCLRAIYFI